MLLGCCHCEGSTSSSSGSSSSVSSSSGSSGPSYSGFPGSCGCDVLPLRWEVTVSGWGSVYGAHLACCNSRDGVYTLTKDSSTKSVGLASYSTCYSWSSAEIVQNQNTATTVAPTCAPVGTIQSRVIAYIAGNTVSGDQFIFVDVRNFVPGGFGGSVATTRFRTSAIIAQGECLYPSLTFYANSDTRCTYGSVSLIPG